MEQQPRQRFIVFEHGLIPPEDQIRRVDRLILPALHLLSDEPRLSIVETLAASGGVLSAGDLREANFTPTSSFFKFVQELEHARLVASITRGHYVVTENGNEILNELIVMGSRLHDSFLARALDTLQGTIGLTNEQLRQIQDIISKPSPEVTKPEVQPDTT